MVNKPIIKFNDSKNEENDDSDGEEEVFHKVFSGRPRENAPVLQTATAPRRMIRLQRSVLMV